MPISEAPANVNEPKGPIETSQEAGGSDVAAPAAASASDPPAESAPAAHTSRWVNYETHELLEMISELEDERRWSRLREGIWLAILFHLLLLSAITWIPKYVFKQPPVINPFDVIRQRDKLTYLNAPPTVPSPRPQVKIKPIPPIDKKALEALNKAPVVPVEKAPPPAPPQPEQKAPEIKPAQPIPPGAKPQVEAPRPAPVPARPNFRAMTQGDPAAQLQRDMQGATQNRNAPAINAPQPGCLAMHPGAGAGGVQILTPTQGVDFSYWLRAWYYDTERTWDPLIPDEVNAPINKAGQVMIRFKVGRDGRVLDGSMQLEGSSGDTALDRAAWGAITGSSYPPLPSNFHGPYIELRALFLYNMQPPQ
ncbi:MAG TPA: energy transducer TonB [Bryobacteraceae bacterium]|nr:energy transducer TonB [Bryobacteraceae bacterium]